MCVGFDVSVLVVGYFMVIGVVMYLFSCGCCKLHVCPGEEKFLSYLILESFYRSEKACPIAKI